MLYACNVYAYSIHKLSDFEDYKLNKGLVTLEPTNSTKTKKVVLLVAIYQRTQTLSAGNGDDLDLPTEEPRKTTRIITFLVGNPDLNLYLLATVTG